MPTNLAEAVDALQRRSDPRLNSDFWRTIPSNQTEEGAIVVGVVHDHPASSYRVRAVAEAVEPDVVALELPETAVPAFEGASAGEMSAAIGASHDAGVVGIDSLGPRFLHRLVHNARAEGASARTLGRVLGDVVGIARHAVACRVGATDPATRPVPGHDVSAADPPSVQADDERTHLARSRALLGAVERPHADLLLDATREGNMAARIRSLRADRSVLAVVGMDHLDSVAARVA